MTLLPIVGNPTLYQSYCGDSLHQAQHSFKDSSSQEQKIFEAEENLTRNLPKDTSDIDNSPLMISLRESHQLVNFIQQTARELGLRGVNEECIEIPLQNGYRTQEKENTSTTNSSLAQGLSDCNRLVEGSYVYVKSAEVKNKQSAEKISKIQQELSELRYNNTQLKRRVANLKEDKRHLRETLDFVKNEKSQRWEKEKKFREKILSENSQPQQSNTSTNETTVTEAAESVITVNESTVNEVTESVIILNETTVNEEAESEITVNETTVTEAAESVITVNETTVNEVTERVVTANETTESVITVNEVIVEGVGGSSFLPLRNQREWCILAIGVGTGVGAGVAMKLLFKV